MVQNRSETEIQPQGAVYSPQKSYKKSNILISSKYRSGLMENKILAVALSKIESLPVEKDGRLISHMYASELRELFGDESGSVYHRLKPIAEGMAGRVIGMEDDKKKEFKFLPIVQSASYEDGVFKIVFNSELRDQIVNIHNKFTLLNLPTMMSFRSVYSFRLYELLKSETFVGNHNCQYNLDGSFEFSLSLAEMKLELGIIDAGNEKVKKILAGSPKPDYEKAVEAAPERRYTEWSELKRRVLDVAKKEINEKTDMKLDYTPERAGRGGRVRSVVFVIMYDKANDKKTEVVEKSVDKTDIIALIDSVMMIVSEKITAKDAEAILKAADYDIDKIKSAYELASGDIDNIVGWLISAIKNDYQKPVKKAGKNKLHNSGNYDIAEIERTLVSNM